MKSNYMKKVVNFVMLMLFSAPTFSAEGFVDLPKAGFPDSAYILCNNTGYFGLEPSSVPATKNTNCSISNKNILESPMSTPLEGFNLVGLISRAVNRPNPDANTDAVEVATLTDTIWRNKETQECIFGTHLLMKDAKLVDGQQFEINDIVRGGFAGRPVAVAYFMKPEPHKEYGLSEALFRAGRTFTSVRHAKGDSDLPSNKNAPRIDKGLSNNQSAAANEDWVDFTTDVSFEDSDKSTRKMTSMLYIKTTCEALQPDEKEDAIRLRMTGQNGQAPFEISVPGLVPVTIKPNVAE